MTSDIKISDALMIFFVWITLTFIYPFNHFKLAYVVPDIAVKEFSETLF